MDTNNAAQIAQTTLDQLGGAGRLTAMIGFHSSNYDKNGVLGFKFRGSRKYNYAQITLADDDTYTVRLVKIVKWDIRAEQTWSGIHADGLRDLFETETKLRLSL